MEAVAPASAFIEILDAIERVPLTFLDSSVCRGAAIVFILLFFNPRSFASSVLFITIYSLVALSSALPNADEKNVSTK